MTTTTKVNDYYNTRNYVNMTSCDTSSSIHVEKGLPEKMMLSSEFEGEAASASFSI